MCIRDRLVGYEDPTTVPEYRILNLTVFGNVSNGVRRYTNYRLPTGGIPQEFRDILLTKHLSISVAVIVEWSKKENLQSPLPTESYGFLMKGIEPSYAIESAWGIFSEGALQQIVVEIRSRLLEFMLELSDKFPDEPLPNEIKQLSKEANVNDIFKGAVFGPGAVLNLAVGSNNTANQSTNHTITYQDLQSLADELRRHNVPSKDIEELKVAIDQDGEYPKKAGTFGPNVKNWFTSMLSKAGSTSWNIAVQTAAGVLTNALSLYYGLSNN